MKTMATNTVILTTASCGLCSQIFSDPRLLPCLHSFCCKCLIKHFEGEESQASLKCPTCQQEMNAVHDGIKNLPKDLRGSYEADVAQYEEKVKNSSTNSCERCIESSESIATHFCCKCCKLLCAQCAADHKRWRDTHDHELVKVGESKEEDSQKSLVNSIPHKAMNCQIHEDEVLKFYCETCAQLICRDCIVLSHIGHSYDRVEKVSDKEKKDLTSVLESAAAVAGKLEDAMARGEKVVQNIRMKQKSIESEIKKTFKNLYDDLYNREELLLTKTSEIALGKITSLEIQSEEMKKMSGEVTSVCSKIRRAANEYTPAEMLSAKKVLKDKLENLIKDFAGCSLEPCKSEIMSTNLDTALLKSDIVKFGVITGGCYAGASTAAIYIPQAIKGKEKRITVTARDTQDKPHPHGGENVSAKLVQLGNDDVSITGKIVDNKDGTYEISITPESIGEHQLKITIENENIKMSPFIINVREARNYSSLSSFLCNFGVSSQPWDIAFGDNEEMFVVDYGYHCIYVKHKANNSNIRTIGIGNGRSGSNEGQFYNPSAIAIKDGVIYVTENSNHRVQKFTTAGKYISKFGTSGSGNGQLSNPRGICIDPDGKIYVSEYSNNRVSVFSADGEFDHHISGNLSNPWGLAFDPQGNLHVANHCNHSITVFDSNEKYVTQYGSGTLHYPAGIAIDPEGYIFISEYEYYSRPEKSFNRSYNNSFNGSYIDPFNGSYIDPFNGSHNYNPQQANYSLSVLNPLNYALVKLFGSFQYSVGVALDNDGYVYVCDSNNHQVCKY